MANKHRFTESSIKNLPVKTTRYRVWDTAKPNLLVEVFPSAKKVFRVYYRHNGKPKFSTLGLWGSITLEQARILATTQSGEAAKGVDLVERKRTANLQKKSDRLLVLETFIDEIYQPWAAANLKSGHESIKLVKRRFTWLLAKPMNKITVSEITQWQSREIERGIKPVTVNRVLAALRGVLTKAFEHDLLDVHPLAKVKNVKQPDEKRIRYLTEQEEDRLRTRLQERNRKKVEGRLSGNRFRLQRNYPVMAEIKGYVDHLEPLVLLAMNTGMRRGELFNLDWSRVDFDNKVLTVSAATAKSSKVRHIPLNAEAQHVLKTLYKPNAEGLVFPNPQQGGVMTTIKKAWGQVVTRAKLSDFRFHDLRHHFASKLVMAGVDLNTVRELLGHASLEMTLRYAHLAPEHKAQAVAVLNRQVSTRLESVA